MDVFENLKQSSTDNSLWSLDIQQSRTKRGILNNDVEIVQVVEPPPKRQRRKQFSNPQQNQAYNNTLNWSDQWKTESNYLNQYEPSNQVYQPERENSLLDLIFNPEPVRCDIKDELLLTINNQPVPYPKMLPNSQFEVSTIVKTLCSTGIQSKTYSIIPKANVSTNTDLSLNHQTERLYHLIQFFGQQICSDFQKNGDVRIFINFPQKNLLFASEIVSLSKITVKSLLASIQKCTKEYFRPATFLLNTTLWTVARISPFSWLYETEEGEVNYEYEWRKQGVVYTDNSDMGSMAKAIAISYAHSISHKAWTSLKLLHSGLQHAVSTELCSRIGLPINCNSIYLIPKFESFLKTRIVVWSAVDGNQVIYPGLQSLPPNKPIHIWLFCGQYFAVTNPETLIQAETLF